MIFLSNFFCKKNKIDNKSDKLITDNEILITRAKNGKNQQ